MTDPSAPSRKPTAHDIREPYNGRFGWGILFALNMVIPGLLATEFVRPIGWIGVVVAALTLGSIGWLALGRSAWWCQTAIVGAALTAATQLLPLLQIWAGANATWLVREVGRRGDRDLGIELAFIATIATGAQLLLLSLILGPAARGLVALLRWSRPSRRTTRQTKGDPTDPLAELGY